MKKTNKIQMVVATGALLGLLAGCGVKPERVDAPRGVSPDTFPQTYPPIRPTDSDTAPAERYLPDYYKPVPQGTAP